ncbi:MAG TPA: AAA family ATPase [Burkholderiales bacterium]|nr:AAA family ATPase [Burkholderiales bacterium]
MLEAIRVNRTCAFCEKPELQVQYLIEGPFAYICNECVATSTSLLEQRAGAADSGKDGERLVRGFAPPGRRYAHEALRAHFAPLASDALVTAARSFPARMRADLQRALDCYLATDGAQGFHGLHYRYAFETVAFAALLHTGNEPVTLAPASYEEIDVGEDEPVRCLENGLWLLERDGMKLAVHLTSRQEYMRKIGMQLEIVVPAGEQGERITRDMLQRIDAALQEARSYRGKMLSLQSDSRSGQVVGVTVHRIDPVAREDIVLPVATLELLERNVVDFSRSRAALARLGMQVKKGLLFYGPPGTGKTYTIRYLASVLPGHTTLIITAEEVSQLKEYMALARFLQPSIVVIEDADLIARNREQMGPCEEVLLNRLLNEMDGLQEDAEVLFILTTNRPEALENAVANRPGRIDQAIEFPLPDADGRRKLAALYGRGLPVTPALLGAVAAKTGEVSPAFIKELMRRTAQLYAESGITGAVDAEFVDRALQEMVFRGGRLNVRLLGGDVSALPELSSSSARRL